MKKLIGGLFWTACVAALTLALLETIDHFAGAAAATIAAFLTASGALYWLGRIHGKRAALSCEVEP